MMLLAGDLGDLTVKQREYIQHILELDEYMISLIDSWKDIDRLSRGQLALEVEPCNIGSVIKQAADLRVQLHRQAHWPMVLADPMRLRQMISNILNVFTKVEARARTNDTFCIVTFHDREQNNARRRAAILEALHTPNPAAELGIRIALLLAEAHGGSLELNPHARQGIRLHLKLPLAQQLHLL